MKNIIRKILKEDREQMFLDNIVKYMKNDFPLFKNLKDYGFYEHLSEDGINYVLSGVFGEPVRVGSNVYEIYNDNGNEIYYEDSDGKWVKREFDENGKLTYGENYTGQWSKSEYDERGERIYYEHSDGYIEDRR